MGSGSRCDMCIAIRDSVSGQRVGFNYREAHLTINEKKGTDSLPWGRREHERIKLPLGGWVRDDLLNQGNFDQWFPRSVLIVADAFCQYDFNGRAHWFSLVPGDNISGVILSDEEQRRVYIPLIFTERHDNHFLYWPKLVKSLYPRDPSKCDF